MIYSVLIVHTTGSMHVNKVLLIDDDAKLGKLLREYFQKFDIQLLVALSPSEGFAIIEREAPRLLILDVMLPEMDGFEVCRRVRSQQDKYGQLPIIMLTARGEVTDRIVGLELGADDYLPKPFEPRELIVRIQSVLRRSPDSSLATEDNAQAKDILEVDGLVLNRVKQTASLDGTPLQLTTMEYALLDVFMKANGKTFHRDELMSELRGIDANLFSRAVDTLVSRLRHKLHDTTKPPRFIKTVWGRGYAFVGANRSSSTTL